MKPNDFSGARVLVTGGAGFIGSALVWALNRRGCDDIVVCDRLGTDEKWRNLAPLRFAEFVEADDLLARLQSGALGKFDLVLHMGACSSTTERDAGFLFRNNFEFTRDLADWSLAKKVRFVYASSAATYGDGSAGMEDDESKLDTLRPLNMYGYSKHLFDLHAQPRRVSGQNCRAEILQRLRPERGSQGRHALARPQKFCAGAKARASSGCSRATGRISATANRSAIFFTSRTPWR